MTWKFNTHYIVTKVNDGKIIRTGDTLLFRREKRGEGSMLGEYIMYLPVRPEQNSFFGLPPVCSTHYFKTKDDLLSVLEGVEVVYNTELVLRIITDKQKEIDKIKENHEIL